MSETLHLPVLPLRDAVLFPGVAAPIAAGRPGTLRAIEAALNEADKLVFAVSQRQNVEKVSPEILYTIGTVAHIEQVQRGLGGVQLLLQGQKRGIGMRIVPKEGYLEATVREAEELPPTDPEDSNFRALHREARELASELGRKSGLPEEVVKEVLASVEDPGRFADLAAGYTEMTPAERQALLETLSVEERLTRIVVLMQRQINVLDAQQDIKSQVQEELGDRQREMFLREQLKAIQKELGEDVDADLKELHDKLETLELPAEAKKEVDRELERLGRIGREAMEAQVIRTFLETVAELPWNERSKEHLNLKEASTILDEDHYGLDDVKDRVLEFLAVRQLQQKAKETADATPEGSSEQEEDEDAPTETEEKDLTPEAESETRAGEGGGTLPGLQPVAEGIDDDRTKGPILLFVGPPGVGKTSVAKSIARAMGRKYIRISLGGARDEADIRGHRRTYVGAMPGRIIQGMRQAGTKNPVFLLDEVDKLGVSFQGDPASALLEVLDPAQNDTFTDHYLGIPFDLSEVLFITTANFIQSIPGPLLDRMEVVEFDGYTEREKLAIARQYLIPRQLKNNGLTEERLTITDDAAAEVITKYTREAGVRQLERELGKLGRKVARRFAAEEVEPTAQVVVERENVRELLGRPRVHPERASREDQVGVATGMFYTPAGGDIMFVESSTMAGKGQLVLTGHLGDVMKESARAAWTWARSHAEELQIPQPESEHDIHVHVPAGAIPKDGPSAGLTMATALVSCLSRRPARHDTAMTGEITLSGRVLPIGGVKEKILGAVRAGITRIVLPKENEPDLEDLPQEVRDRIEIHAVEKLNEALACTLRGASYRDGHLVFDEAHTDEPALLQTES